MFSKVNTIISELQGRDVLSWKGTTWVKWSRPCTSRVVSIPMISWYSDNHPCIMHPGIDRMNTPKTRFLVQFPIWGWSSSIFFSYSRMLKRHVSKRFPCKHFNTESSSTDSHHIVFCGRGFQWPKPCREKRLVTVRRLPSFHHLPMRPRISIWVTNFDSP